MINGVHLHLLLNHVPILGSVFALVLLIIGYFNRNDILSKTGLWTLVVVSVIAIPVFLSGEEAEHAVEGIMGVSEVSIETHEDQAAIAFWSLMCSGAIALGTLLSALKSQNIHRTLLLLNVFLMLGTFVLMARAGNSGGAIRHPEINATTSSSGGEEEHEDD